MCGRFTQTVGAEKLSEKFNVPKNKIPTLKARYNIAPSTPIAVLLKEKDIYVDMMHWGLVPSWAKDTSTGIINARRETLTEKPSFRGSFKHNRCLILADGFYEWKKTDGKKQPYYFCLRTRAPFGFAGLWSYWIGPDGSALRSCTIITTEANDVMKSIHNRMPVLLPDRFRDEWLDPYYYDEKKLDTMLAPYPADEMEVYPVSYVVSSPKNDSPACIEKFKPKEVPQYHQEDLFK